MWWVVFSLWSFQRRGRFGSLSAGARHLRRGAVTAQSSKRMGDSLKTPWKWPGTLRKARPKAKGCLTRNVSERQYRELMSVCVNSSTLSENGAIAKHNCSPGERGDIEVA